jgi:hypothetical protein
MPKIDFIHESQVIEMSTFSFCQYYKIPTAAAVNSTSKGMFRLNFYNNMLEKIFLELLQYILPKKNTILVNLIVIKKSYKQLHYLVCGILIRCIWIRASIFVLSFLLFSDGSINNQLQVFILRLMTSHLLGKHKATIVVKLVWSKQ